MNWRGGLAALIGAVVGGIGAVVVQGARNRPLGDAALVCAALGGIVGASVGPSGVKNASAGTT